MKIYYKIGIIVFGLIIVISLVWLFAIKPKQQVAVQPKDLDQILQDLSSNTSDQFVESRDTQNQFDIPASIQDNQPIEVDLQPISAAAKSGQDLSNFVSRFIERWGTYSNQTDFESIKSLDSQMTLRMQRFVDDYIATIKQDHPYQNGYFGITTKSVLVNISPPYQGGEQGGVLAATNLAVTVSTRRTESTDFSTDTYNQKVDVRLVKISGDWVIDGVFWQDK